MMKKSVIHLLLGSLASVLFFVTAISAQQGPQTAAPGWSDIRDKYVISAKAGGVNFVEGSVTVAGKDGTSTPLLKGDGLEAGDRVTTGNFGRAEILLNPGSYARIGSNSSFEFKTTSLNELEINLHSGTAIFEVFASKDFQVTLNTPKGKFYLIQAGVYRLDVLESGGGRIMVHKGRAQLGDKMATIVKNGNEATLTGTTSQIAKLNSDDKDQFYSWSKSRAKDLARISRKVDQASMRSSLINSFRGSRWNMYNSFGLWVFDASYGFSFLPFGWGWNSPYGYGFGNCIYHYNLPPVVFYPPVYTGNGGGGTGTGGGGGVWTNTPLANNPRDNGGVRPPLVAPPFVRIQNDTKSGLNIDSVGDFGGGRPLNNVRSDGSVSTPAAPSAPPPPPPAPVYVPPASSVRTDTKKDN